MEEYSYVYTGGKLMQMVVKTTTTPVDSEATTTTETLNLTYDASGTPLSVNFCGTDYYYVANIQGDIMAILNTSGTAVVEYTYDAWGKQYSTNGTLADTLGEFDLPWICVQLRSGPGLSPERIFRYQSRSVSSSMGMDCQPHGKMGRTHWQIVSPV